MGGLSPVWSLSSVLVFFFLSTLVCRMLLSLWGELGVGEGRRGGGGVGGSHEQVIFINKLKTHVIQLLSESVAELSLPSMM